MNIVLYHQYFIFPDQAGSTRMYYLVQEMIRRGHRVTVVAGKKIRKSLGKEGNAAVILDHKHSPNLTIISINDFYEQKLPFVKRMLSFFVYVLVSIPITLTVRKPSLVFASSTPLTIAIPSVFSARINKVPFFLEIRDLWPEAPIQLGILRNRTLIVLATCLERWAYKHARTIVALSRGIKKKIRIKLRRMGKSSTSVFFIPNGVDEQFFDDTAAGIESQLKDNRDKSVTAIYAGSCGFNNAIDTIFSAIETVAGDCNTLRFIIVGDGPALTDYKNRMYCNVTFTGKVSKLTAIELLKQADIALYPQRKVQWQANNIKKDSLPNKFFDYIGAGLPIVGAIEPDGEVATLLDTYHCGVHVVPEDTEGFSRLIRRLHADTETRRLMAANAKALAERFRRKKQMQEYVTMLERESSGRMRA